MIRRLSVAAVSVCIGACATSGPEAPEIAAEAVSAPVDAVATANPTATPVKAVALENPPAQGEEGIYALPAPAAPQVMTLEDAIASGAIVCRKEKAIGTQIMKRVCYSREQLEARAEHDQRWWYRLRRP